MLSEVSKKLIDKALQKYPYERRKSATMDALSIAQKQNNGRLTNELIAAVANYLDLPKISVAEVATFYSLYSHNEVGQNKIYICQNISCYLRGCDDLIKYMEDKFGVLVNQPTKDGKFSVHKVECLGACIDAPVMRLNGKFHCKLNKKNLDKIIEQL